MCIMEVPSRDMCLVLIIVAYSKCILKPFPTEKLGIPTKLTVSTSSV